MVIRNDDASFLLAAAGNRNIFFELHTGGNALLYTLPINPGAMQVSDPFVLSVEPGLDGRLTIQRGGTVARKIVLTGTTGMALKKVDSPPSQAVVSTKASFNSRLDDVVISDTSAFSGAAHFQFLQDRIFRAYADLVRDPATTKDTTLSLFNPLDEQYWVVEPLSFEEIRSERLRNLQYYQITLLAVDKADARPPARSVYVPSTTSPAFGIGTAGPVAPPPVLTPTKVSGLTAFEKLKQGIAEDLAAINGFSLTNQFPAFADVVNGINDAVGLISDVIGFVSTTAQVIQRTVAGLTALANSLASAITTVASGIHSIANLFNGIQDDILSIVDNLAGSFDAIAEALDNLDASTHRGDQFRGAAYNLGQATDRMLVALKLKAEADATGTSSVALRQANAIAQGRSVDDGEGTVLGESRAGVNRTGFLAGERDAYLAGAQEGVPVFKSIRRVLVRPGDTIESLAQNHMGDVKLSRIVALINKLRFPFISAADLPGTVKAGDTIQIPSTEAPRLTSSGNGTSILPGLSAEGLERFLGRDILLARGDGGFGWALRPDKLDIDNSVGLTAYTEALEFSLSVEQGTYPQSPDVGVKRFIGSAGTQDVVTRTVLGIRACVENDPRTVQISNVKVRLDGDLLRTTMTVIAHGDTKATPLDLPVG